MEWGVAALAVIAFKLTQPAMMKMVAVVEERSGG
jgi:hypothetical protein